ncbi:MAG: hypothetical protein SFV54_17330 [Bryobacteraceae bacterium]|nr:hypothetical protein [Bryobacteraceae bacterium]
MIEVKMSQFRLRLNGKEVLPAQPASFVAAAIKYEDWERRPGFEGNAGPLIFGRRTPEPRFPGDRRPAEGRGPAPPRAPGTDAQADSEQAPLTADVAAVEGALPEGPREKPGRGYLYFNYRGKTKKLKSVELLYDGPAGTAVLKLL